MGELYLTATFGHGERIATYANGEIMNGSAYWSHQKVIGKYSGNIVTEAYVNSSTTIGHVSGKFGYLGAPYLTSTATPFIYADTCNRIYLYSTRNCVAEFEGDMTGALLAYMAYYCYNREHSKEEYSINFRHNRSSDNHVNITDDDDGNGIYVGIFAIVLVIVIVAAIKTAVTIWGETVPEFIQYSTGSQDVLPPGITFFDYFGPPVVIIIASVIAFIINAYKGIYERSIRECATTYITTYAIVTAIYTIVCVADEGISWLIKTPVAMIIGCALPCVIMIAITALIKSMNKKS